MDISNHKELLKKQEDVARRNEVVKRRVRKWKLKHRQSGSGTDYQIYMPG
jgi:hypothetical protein